MAEGRSVALGIGIGCLTVVLGLMAMAGACGLWAYRQTREIEEGMQDPEVRRQKVLDVLGTDALPRGYHPVAGFSVPFLLDTAIIGDEPPPAGQEPAGDLGERGFIYVETVGLGQDEQQLRSFFEGRTTDPAVLEENGIDVDIDTVIDRGTLPGPGDSSFMYIAQRGDLAMQSYRGGGLSAVVLVDCPEDERRRIGFWFVPDPAPGAPIDELELQGTPADPEALREFLAHFTFCR